MAYAGGFDWGRVGGPQQGDRRDGGLRDGPRDGGQWRGGRGRGRGGHGGRHDAPLDPRAEAEARLRDLVVGLADRPADADKQLRNLANILYRDYAAHAQVMLAAFRAAIAGLPHKAAFYAVLVGLVAAEEAAAAGGPPAVDGFLRTAMQALDEALRGCEWWEVMSLLRFFCELVNAGVVAPASHLALLRTLAGPLATHPTGSSFPDSFCYILLDTLPHAAKALWSALPDEAEALYGDLAAYVEKRAPEMARNAASLVYFRGSATGLDALGELFSAVRGCKEAGWELPFLSTIRDRQPKLRTVVPRELPGTVSLPSDNPDLRFPLVGGPLLFIFDDASRNAEPVIHHLPSTSSFDRHYLRMLALLLLRLSIENRKPAVQAFLSLPDHFPALPENNFMAYEAVVETIVADVQRLPNPLDSAPLYQNSVMCDFLGANPKDIAPLLGRCVRRWFDRIDNEECDVGCVKRTAEYLAVHLSNFGWKWSWDRWLPALSLDKHTARHAFLRHFLSQMIRLSYWEHTQEALPRSWHPSMPPPTGTDFRYAPESGADPAVVGLAAEIVAAVRSRKEGWLDEARAAVERLRAWARENPAAAAAAVGKPGDAPAEAEDALARDVVMQALMVVGSKSFSHVLAAMERSLPLLRDMFPSHRYSADPAAWKAMRQALRAVWDFNARANTQFLEIVVDKLLNYRVLDAPSVFEWIMDRAVEDDMYSEFWLWNIMLSTLSKVVLRVKQLTVRVEAARKALAALPPPKFVPVDSDNMESEAPADEEYRKAQEELERVGNLLSGAQRDEKESFGTVFKKFVAMLKAHIEASTAAGQDPEQAPFWRYASGFMREIGRSYADAIRSMVVTVETLAFEGGNEYGSAAVDGRIWAVWKEVKDGVLTRKVV
ncbi:armadillo-type protein [Hyaloraphidium curvatum]|nr:armadillo-type protein [Hyaloraphidium curvatum]